MKMIMGLDPGSHKTGFGVIQVERELQAIASGVIDIPRNLSFPKKLAYLQEALRELLVSHPPHCVVVEKIFFGKNADSAFKLGHVRGVCLAQVAQAQKIFKEYAARTVKKAITGYGGASKEHVQLIVRETLGIQETLREDASDALALALTHMYVDQTKTILAQQTIHTKAANSATTTTSSATRTANKKRPEAQRHNGPRPDNPATQLKEPQGD